MSVDNSIIRGESTPDVPVVSGGFELPPDLASRYTVRIVDNVDGEQRIGLFRSMDRDNPSIEITDDRIVARREDAETVAALVEIARHSGWERIAVEGSPAFKKAVWEAGTREGLVVSGYEPSFAEQARAERSRRDPAGRHVGQEEDRLTVPTHSETRDAPVLPIATATPKFADESADRDSDGLSASDRRLLLTLSRHTEDRRDLERAMRPDLDAFEREVQDERLDINHEALTSALERALNSSTLTEAFDRSGYDADTLREDGRRGRWNSEVADAIHVVRLGIHRDALLREAEIEPLREPTSPGDAPAGKSPAASAQTAPDDRDPLPQSSERKASREGRSDSDELAELFLHGAHERIAAEPRLAPALQAQTVMEHHIGEVFDGDANRMATANLESRRMISDALRHGLDVAVREPTPIRQIEPVQSPPDFER